MLFQLPRHPDLMHFVPGTFGEPFRILELLPGTVPIANGQPYVYLRGAPPSGTVYLYDDIPIPLRPAAESPFKSDYEILKTIEQRIRQRQGMVS